MGRSPCAPERAVTRFSAEIIPEAEAYLWYFASTPLAADAFRTEVLDKIDSLVDDADTWPKDENGIHFRILSRFPYTVHYGLEGGVATILAVAHQRREPGYWKLLGRRHLWTALATLTLLCQSGANGGIAAALYNNGTRHLLLFGSRESPSLPGAAATRASHSAGVAGGFFRIETDFMLLCFVKTDDVRFIVSLCVCHVHDDAFKPAEQVDSFGHEHSFARTCLLA